MMEAMPTKQITFVNLQRTKEMLRKEIQRSADIRYGHRLHAVLLVFYGRSRYKLAKMLSDALHTVDN